MRINILFLAIPFCLLNSCFEKEEYTYNRNGEIISVVVNDKIKLLFKNEFKDFSVVKEEDSSTVIYKFQNERFREVDSIKKSQRVTQILFREDNTISVYKTSYFTNQYINIILENYKENDVLTYSWNKSNHHQDYTQFFVFVDDTINNSKSSFFKISTENVIFNLPSLNEEIIKNTTAQVNVYDRTLESYNSRIINNRVFISDTFLIKVFGNLNTSDINVPLYNNTDMRITLFDKDDDQFYTTYLYNVNRENQFYKRAKNDYKKLNSLIENISLSDVTEEINKILINIDGFAIQKNKIIISKNIMNRLRNI